jgi:hypothetical protein
MVLCMGVSTGAISAGAAVIRRQPLQERSWKPPSRNLLSGSCLLSVGGRQNRHYFTLHDEKVGRKLPECMVASQQNYARDERAREALCASGKGSAG